jgi:hypothetical protein
MLFGIKFRPHFPRFDKIIETQSLINCLEKNHWTKIFAVRIQLLCFDLM